MTKRLPAVAMLLLALSGCGDDAGTSPAKTPAPAATTAAATTAAATTATARTADGPDAFVAAVRRSLPEVAADRREDEIGALAQQACTALDKGDDADTIVARTRGLGTADAEAVDQATARELVKLAIDTVCPDQDRRVDEF
ncbi:DUF732 domain-containing protein [Couchioplanes caeruleus]|uniref:DUF732 domain-containing protein n=1 Tax=Couchioplanes caeruleus TaxID=56438 RepID=UPI0020BD6B58|nr:DUF732 domain-containing protein [Couchioplanes caeruleus]UQU68257.1 DUF732 domain-containing protein [Couchioplanes caeruleus]